VVRRPIPRDGCNRPMKLPNLARIKRVLELRRSNAAQPIKSKKAYTRKVKHKKVDYDR